jgi:hypothetical protein
MGKEGMHTGFQWRNLKERDYLVDAGVDGMDGRVWTSVMWPSTDGRMLNVAMKLRDP